MTDAAGVEGARRTEIPWQLRGAWWFEMLFLPVVVVSLAALPLDDGKAWALVGAQAAVAVAVIYGLKRRSRLAWVAAMLLAALVVGRTLASVPGLARDMAGGPARDQFVIAVAIVAWAVLTQLGVLLFCLAMFWGGRWRRELD
jgi:hypothetical protein